MAYSNESVMAKMSSLSETQESIVTVAQWLMFYRKNAKTTAEIWLEKMKTSNSSKRLNLIYLANEIMQQANGRKKMEFIEHFGNRVAEASALAYKGSTQEVQQKLRRVIEVWRERRVLGEQVLRAVESAVDGLDKSRSARSTGPQLGGQLFSSSSVPTEFQPLTQSHATLAKSEAAARPLVEKANTAHDAHTSAEKPATQSAPVQIGQLSALMRSLASAESAVSASIKARKELVSGLEKMLETHESKLADDERTIAQLASRRTELDTQRKVLEDLITRNVSASEAPPNDASPDTEGFTPPRPSTEDLSPPGTPALDARPASEGLSVPNGVDMDLDAPTTSGTSEPAPTPATSDGATIKSDGAASASHALDILASLRMPGGGTAMAASPTPPTDADPRKKRKTSHNAAELEEQLFADDDGLGLDADVAANLGAA